MKTTDLAAFLGRRIVTKGLGLPTVSNPLIGREAQKFFKCQKITFGEVWGKNAFGKSSYNLFYNLHIIEVVSGLSTMPQILHNKKSSTK